MNWHTNFYIFYKNHDLDPNKRSTLEAFRRHELGLPWEEETSGGECPECGKAGVKITGARWYCFYCGKGGVIEGAAVVELTEEQRAAERQLRREQDAERSARALKIWNEQCVPIGTKNTSVNAYFSARCLSLSVLPDLDSVMRWHGKCPFGKDFRGRVIHEPCIVSLFRDALTDRPTAVHRTHITNSREGRSERMAMGPMAGGVIKLWPLKGEAVAVGEGIETVLAAVMLGVGTPPAWAATVAGNLSRIPVIPNVRRLTILADNDPEGTGKEKANILRGKWKDQGKEVDAKWPTKAKDFNEVLIRIRRGQS